MTKENFYFECDCSLPTHTIHVTYDEDFCYITTSLSTSGFWKRVKYGIKYIVGWKSDYGEFQETLLSPESAQELINVLESFVRKKAKDPVSTPYRQEFDSSYQRRVLQGVPIREGTFDTRSSKKETAKGYADYAFGLEPQIEDILFLNGKKEDNHIKLLIINPSTSTTTNPVFVGVNGASWPIRICEITPEEFKDQTFLAKFPSDWDLTKAKSLIKKGE